MTYQDVQTIIPYKRPFFRMVVDGIAFSSGILLMLEQATDFMDFCQWAEAISDAIIRFDEGDYGTMYDVGERPTPGREYGIYKSPFGETIQNGAIWVHAELGNGYNKVFFFGFER